MKFFLNPIKFIFILTLIHQTGYELAKSQDLHFQETFELDLNQAYLKIQFTDTLVTPVSATDSLPFTFLILSPKDSISIKSSVHIQNKTGSEVLITFSTKPETSYSLLFYNALGKHLGGMSQPFSKNFNTYSSTPSNTDTLTYYSTIVYCTNSTSPSSYISILGLLKKSTINFHPNQAQTIFDNLTHIVSKTGLFEQDTINIYTPKSDSLASVLLYFDRESEPLTYQFGSIQESKPPYSTLSSHESSFFYRSSSYLSSNSPLLIIQYICVSIESNPTIKPTFLSLESAYPNPFNPSTSVSFSVSEPSRISFSVFDVLGRKVKELSTSESHFSSGKHQFSFDFSSLASGVYVIEASGISLSSGVRSTQTIKVSLAK